MKSQTAIQKLLFTKLAELQAKNPAYSLRAFSKKLGVSPSTVSMVMGGSRAVSAKLARKLCDALLLDPQSRSEALAHFPDRGHYRRQRMAAPGGRGADSVDAGGEVLGPNYLQLSADQFHLMSEWYYHGILSLIKTRGFRGEPAWIARRLGIGQPEAQTAIERLKRLGLLVEREDGTLRRSAPQYRTTDDVADISLRKSHFQGLELARQSLEQDPIDRRDFTYLTLPMDPRLLGEAKERIRQFQDELDSYLESRGGELTEVYRLAVQLFPLSKPVDESRRPPKPAKPEPSEKPVSNRKKKEKRV